MKRESPNSVEKFLADPVLCLAWGLTTKRILGAGRADWVDEGMAAKRSLWRGQGGGTLAPKKDSETSRTSVSFAEGGQSGGQKFLECSRMPCQKFCLAKRASLGMLRFGFDLPQTLKGRQFAKRKLVVKLAVAACPRTFSTAVCFLATNICPFVSSRPSLRFASIPPHADFFAHRHFCPRRLYRRSHPHPSPHTAAVPPRR